MTKLENTKWQSLYKTKYIPNSGDLFLVLDAISFNISVEMNSSTWKYTPPNGETVYTISKWQELTLPKNPMNTSISFTMTLLLNASTGNFELFQPDQRVIVPLVNYSKSLMPVFDFPQPIAVDVTNETWDELLLLNPDSWMYPPFHIDYAFSEPVPNSSSVQLSLAFMLVVIICNALKILVIYRTLKEPLSSQILTFGDAVSSFLEDPDPTTVGLCTLEKEEIMKSVQSPHTSSDFVKPWQYRRRFIGDRSVGRWVSNIFLWVPSLLDLRLIVYLQIFQVVRCCCVIGHHGSHHTTSPSLNESNRFPAESNNPVGLELGYIFHQRSPHCSDLFQHGRYPVQRLARKRSSTHPVDGLLCVEQNVHLNLLH
jgi:hypothetical protein